ncbi:TatD family hydrolase [Candidatus Formimonas warabiya]|uniref:Hydrolase TatD n=1 Tax=Formimonas warabiya TaxID=1761012 RepID=A0A3G1KVN7_FORW1|nr:TatD family hydrolase [Candidatus Formimonas warabiya]ATW26467.1 hydrolase TatD [Candidatus Formimonas warabiya]
MLFDTHAHLNDEQFAGDVPETIERAKEAGVTRIAVVGYDLASSIESIKIAKRYGSVYAVIGVHPHDAATLDGDTLTKLRVYAREPEVVAIGEIGLDYYRNLSPRQIQVDAFRTQIHLAKELKKPIVIHDRDAHEDTVNMLRSEQAGENGGILHCFSGSWEMARQCMSLGFHISIAGPVTYHNANKLLEIAKLVPLDRLLVETDCPYLAPHPFRGKRNEPARVRLVGEKIAELRRISLEQLAEATTKNALTVFEIK